MKQQQQPHKNTVARRAAHAAITIGAVVLFAAAPQLARADAPAATSVDVQAVSVTPANLSSEGQEQGVVRVVFADTNSVAAREVVFQVIGRSGAVRQQINDQGTFEPGARIAHTFEVPGAQADDLVQVAAVQYADGSIWTADGARVEDENQQSVFSSGRAANRRAENSRAEILRDSYLVQGALAP